MPREPQPEPEVMAILAYAIVDQDDTIHTFTADYSKATEWIKNNLVVVTDKVWTTRPDPALAYRIVPLKGEYTK